MIFYYVVFFTISLFAFGEINERRSGKKLALFYFANIFLYFLSFLRWETGTDWTSYITIYNQVEWDNMWIVEPVFGSVNIISRTVFDNYSCNLWVLSSIMFYYQTKAIAKFSLFPLVSLMMLVGMQFGNVFFVRQNIAVALSMISVYYIIKRKFILYILFSLLAIGFHFSAIVFLPAWWVFNLKLDKKKWLLYIIISSFSSFAFSPLLNYIGDLIGGGVYYRLIFYLEKDVEANPNMSVLTIIVKTIVNKSFFFIVGYYLYDLQFKGNGYLKNFFNLYCFGIIMFFLTAPISIHFSRAAWFYDIYQIILVPYLFAYLSLNKRKILFAMLFALLCVKLYLYIFSYEDSFVPYKMVNLI